MMTSILDDLNILLERDPSGALGVVADQFLQASFEARVENSENDGRKINNVIVTGMGGSALAALVLKSLTFSTINVPFEIIRGYDLPDYANENTLVIASSYSGNTEETLSAYEQAKKRGSQLAILTSGGELIRKAQDEEIAYVELPTGSQPRMATIAGLKGLVALFTTFKVIDSSLLSELTKLSTWLESEISAWLPTVPFEKNYSKQLASVSIGKTPVFYGSAITSPIAYKWKISWNETAKNLAFFNEYPEFNHNEFMGWTSHPVEKPFVVFDIRSSFDHERISKRFDLSDKLLSGKRPAANVINLKGETPLAQLIWGAVLADFSSVYAGILNGVDPSPVHLIEKLKVELSS